jgi:hypothetical protein
VWRSRDGGDTWELSLHVAPERANATFARFYSIHNYKGKLYAQAQDVGFRPQSMSKVFDGGSWSDGPDLSGGLVGFLWHPETFADHMVYQRNHGGVNMGRLFKFDGAQASLLSPPGATQTFYDYTITEGILYGLLTDGRIVHTSDLLSWQSLDTAPSSARSLGVLDGMLYVGATGGQLYQYSVPVPEPAALPLLGVAALLLGRWRRRVLVARLPMNQPGRQTQSGLPLTFFLMCATLGSAGAYAQPHLYQVKLDGSDALTFRSYDATQALSKSNETITGDPDKGGDYIITRSSAAAGWGSLRVSAHAYLDFPIAAGGVGPGNGTSAESYFLVQDLIISGPGEGPVMATFNLHLAGGASANVVGMIEGTDWGLGAGANIRVDAGADGLPGPRIGGTYDTHNVFGADGLWHRGEGGTGDLEGFAGDVILSSGPHPFPINTPFSVFASMSAQAGVSSESGRSAEAISSFTLSFVTDRPVFDVPPGYTINSANGTILNNRFVPEPSALVLFCCGPLILARHQRRIRFPSAVVRQRTAGG